ncbi:MAG: VOC family protein [Sciscionella sp.]
MATDGIEAVFLTTHNWGKAAKFCQALGFTLEFETDHASGQFRGGDGPYVFIAEVPEDEEPHVQLVLKVPDAEAFQPDSALDVITPFEDTHYGTREMTVRDPDGRLWSLQAPAKRDRAEGAFHGG